ncbi:glycine betaine/proline transport system substrate-binding protein [Haloactinopolyspora alba]|uniref:Glycine betaine/proline transport system substrate-binding protein n=1 Tax=Haloactinopolyspora alba TaxID=648780 RepID=A0A2P8EG26_9ACTN|nr:ABC transporter substrate-binding protein [Haloactinopolyspora alba]PSL08423.1 glycine betaine/proline transport system substrate-binding protein [Haloactinopolyspora alba]
MPSRLRRAGPVAAAASAALILVACGGDDGGGDSGGGGDASSELRLIQQPWEDLIVENQIVSQILGDLGYEVEINEVAVPIGAQALANGEADAYLGNWWPSQESAFQKYLDEGSVQVVDTLVTGTTYAPAVPKYVAEQHGITSLADLDEKAELFEHRFVGIEAGTPGNKYISDAIAADAYGLGDWTLAESSTSAMLAEVKNAAAEQQPIVFLGWEPHWMNVTWDLVYLEDPEDVWPGAGEIRVVANEEYQSENPNVMRFLQQMSVERSTASDWIHQFSQEDVPAEEIASTWIEENPDVVSTWLEGVETADGEPAEAA